jgi:hypothetical protein
MERKGKEGRKSGFVTKFRAEVHDGRLFPERLRNEAIERELRQFPDGSLVRVLVFKIGPNIGPWNKGATS